MICLGSFTIHTGAGLIVPEIQEDGQVKPFGLGLVIFMIMIMGKVKVGLGSVIFMIMMMGKVKVGFLCLVRKLFTG